MDPVEERLRASRPHPSPAEFERAKRDMLARVAKPQRGPRLFARVLAPSRVATTGLLVAGFLVTGASAGLAVSGISSSGSAGVAQYPRLTGPTETTETTGTTGTPPTTQGQPPKQEASPEQATGEEREVQGERQVSSNDADELPFTGLAAIPLLLVGGVMLSTGFVLRRSAEASDR
jgi:hypothetical protein